MAGRTVAPSTASCASRLESREYKDLVKYWLTFNEINTPLMGGGPTFSLGMLPETEELRFGKGDALHGEEATRIVNGIHHQFLASARTVLEGRRSTWSLGLAA